VGPVTEISLGQIFVRVLYGEKENGSYYAKVWINSAHGKWSEHPEKDCYTLFRPSRYLEREGLEPEGPYWHWSEIKDMEGKGLCPPHCQPIAAMQTLSRARVHLWRIDWALQQAGWEVYYNDTDSVMTNCPPERMPVALGKELGMLAYEHGPCKGYFLGPKAYLLLNDNNEVVKQALKGVPLKSYKDGLWDKDDEGRVYAREARRARPGRPAEQGHDIREEVFRAALQGGARCYKEGVTSFLRGLSGVVKEKTIDGETVHVRESMKWQRASLTRDIRTSGRGKSFGDKPGEWVYLTTQEMNLAVFLNMLPAKRGHWERQSEGIRRRCIEEQLVTLSPLKIILTEKGRAMLTTLTQGADLSDMPDPSDFEGEYEDSKT
jgi:hypothetical protein